MANTYQEHSLSFIENHHMGKNPFDGFFMLKIVNIFLILCYNKDVSSLDSSYEPLPLNFEDAPSHPLCEKLGQLVEKNLEFYRNQMTEKGVWEVPWSWGTYPEEFKVAEVEWKGILAVTRYKQLKAFGYWK
jgi:hypothetical protein